jgi:hypothetical protein
MAEWLKGRWRSIKAVFRGTDQPEDRYVGGLGLVIYGFLLAAIGLALASGIFDLWPAVDEATEGAAENRERVALLWGLIQLEVNKATGLILLVLLMGGLGAYVHAATSFASYAGNRTLRVSWMWWYGQRILVGAALALGFYFAITGGLFSLQESSEDINAYGTAAFAFVIGLFSKQAIDKLEELFNVLLRTDTAGDRGRRDKLDQRPPLIRRLLPTQVKKDQPVELTIRGQRFRRGARVRLDDRIKRAEFHSDTKLTVSLTAADLEREERIRVAVFNPPPEDEQSNIKELRVGGHG